MPVAGEDGDVVAGAILHAPAFQVQLDVTARAVGRSSMQFAVDCDNGLDGSRKGLVHLSGALAFDLSLSRLVHDVSASARETARATRGRQREHDVRAKGCGSLDALSSIFN